MPTTLHLLVPGLLGPWPGDTAFPTLAAPALQRLLALARVQHLPVSGADAILCHLFGVPIATAADLPVAAITRLNEGSEPVDGWWLRADPVHLHAEPPQAILFDARLLRVAMDEARALATVFNQHYGDAGLHLETPQPNRWYLHLAEDPGLRTVPLAEAIGRDIGPLLPQGPAARRWRALLTEVQMLFYQHPVNSEREARGQPLINSVWFWGGGRLPASARSPAEGLYAADPLARGLARLAGAAVSPLPDNAADWRAAGTTENTALVVLEATRYEAADNNVNGWRDQLAALDLDWFAPCLNLLRRRVLTTLHLYPGNGRVYTVTRGDLWRFWRRSRPWHWFSMMLR